MGHLLLIRFFAIIRIDCYLILRYITRIINVNSNDCGLIAAAVIGCAGDRLEQTTSKQVVVVDSQLFAARSSEARSRNELSKGTTFESLIHR